jgi:outer membrane protein TolC
MNLERKALTAVLCMMLGGVGARAQMLMPPPSSPAAAPVGLIQSSSQNPTAGSVPAGTVSSQLIPISLADAIERGLRQNLGALLSQDEQLTAHGELIQSRSPLLPDLSARISETAQKINLAAEGFGKVVGRFPGFPLVIGPFGYFDARLVFSQSLLNLNALASERSSRENVTAVRFSYQDIREAVVLVVGAAYLQTIAASARMDTADAQVQTAQALYNQAVDMRNVGVSAGIDVLRAQVELQAQRQQLIAARNDFAKQKLALARTIGLPLAQDFTLTEKIPFQAPEPITVEEIFQEALRNRPDFQAALSQMHAAELMTRAATAEHLPSVSIYADYGLIGVTPGSSVGTFTTYAALNIPIFVGGRSRGDAQIAQAEVNRSRQQVDNLRAQIEQDVRSSILDLQADADQVSVAMSNVDLAQRTLAQARDRFASGATDNIEVVQAQEAVAGANESYISSLYAFNLARLELARAEGTAEKGFRQYWKEK